MALRFPPPGPLWDYNKIINGGFFFIQRLTAVPATFSNIGGRSYTADRWALSNETASVQLTRVDTLTTPAANLLERFYGKYVKITNAGKIQLSQVVEGSIGAPLRTRIVRVQASMRFAVAASMTMNLGLVQLANAGTVDAPPAAFVTAYGASAVDPTLGANLAYIAPIAGTGENGTIVTNGVQCGLTAVFQRYGAAFTVPSDCKNLFVVLWSDQQLAVNDEFHVSQVGLYDGVQAVDWMPLGVEVEQQRVLRYYSKTFNVGTAPLAAAGVTTGASTIASPVIALTALTGWEWRFPVPMRSGTPTLASFNPFGAGVEARDVTAAADCTATAVANNGAGGCFITTTTPAAAVVGDRLALHITADAEI